MTRKSTSWGGSRASRRLLQRAVLVAWLGAAMGAAADAPQLRTVGVVDSNRIYTTYFRESRAVREYEQQRRDFEEELEERVAEITRLQSDRLDAINDGDDSRVLQLDREIVQRSQIVSQFRDVKQQELDLLRTDLLASDVFYTEVQAAIEFVSRSEGFTLVLDAREVGLLWWSPEVDITDEVLSRLRSSR
jgi:outer membrane protein